MTRFSADNTGFQLENVIHNELVRRGYSVEVGTLRTGEVDFVARRADETVYVQVCETMVDPATRDYVLHMIKENLPDGATVLISTHLIADVEPILDEFLFLFNGRVVRYDSADDARAEEGKSLDAIFREAFRC